MRRMVLVLLVGAGGLWTPGRTFYMVPMQRRRTTSREQ
jgi:hypothetical protein